MVSNVFFTGSVELIEHSDGRHEYVQYEGEKCLRSLVTVGQKIHEAPFVPEDEKSEYLDAISDLNEHYFDAREFEEESRGKYYRYDEEAEQHFRIEVAERVDDVISQLHALLDAHDTLLDAALEAVADAYDGTRRKDTADSVEQTILKHTNLAIHKGWFLIVEAYNRSLDPGERVSEGRKRHRQRIEGDNIRGLRKTLDSPHFQKLRARDLERIRKINTRSPVDDLRLKNRLEERYDWMIEWNAGSSDSLSA